MKIPHDLPQFEGQRALIVSLGTHAGKCFLATDGSLSEVLALVQEKPRYSDREGFFMTAGRGGVYQTGSVYEDKSDEEARRFIRRVAHELRKLVEEHRITDIYLFDPQNHSPFIRRALPKAVWARIRFEGAGNYTKHPPLAMLRRLKEDIDFDHVFPPLRAPREEEAQRILQKSRPLRRKARRKS